MAWIYSGSGVQEKEVDGGINPGLNPSLSPQPFARFQTRARSAKNSTLAQLYAD
jgi:hypothetical protein